MAFVAKDFPMLIKCLLDSSANEVELVNEKLLSAIKYGIPELELQAMRCTVIAKVSLGYY